MTRTTFLIALLLFAACKNGGITIYAPAELAGGTIYVDGKEAGHFEKTQRLYRWVGWAKLKAEVSAPPRSDAMAVLPALAPGPHVMKITKSGYKPIVTTFNYLRNPTELEIDDALVRIATVPQ